MIRITVDLVPLGFLPAKNIGTAIISNDGTGTETKGNYEYAILGKKGRLVKEGKIKGFPRKRMIVWDLIYRVLADAIGARNEP